MNADVFLLAEIDAPRLAVARPMIGMPPRRESLPLTSVATLVVWLSCAGMAAVGATLQYTRPTPKRVEPPAVQAEALRVQLTDTPPPQWTPPPSAHFSAPPPPSNVAALPSSPAAIAVAAPSASVAFAVPVSGPVRVVDVAEAGYRGQSSSSVGVGTGLPSPQTLVFGEGDGRQPAPAYPARAARQGQEGVVGVRLTVDAQGRVVAAEAAQPCVWPLLNEAAVRTVRDSWRFGRGALRVYDVAIRFRLKR